MDLEQRVAERNFQRWGKPASYTDGSGSDPVMCRVIRDQGIDEFADDRVRVPRMEFSLLVSEVGSHKPGALITVNGVEYQVRHLLEDDGTVRRVVVEN
ncbi:head-tail joining protein [Microbulbifer spongiae]|uniref:Head-tail adaptor protein n=1 Tax=Microbulbifer spongiae TaxID=2944933 RepID=A0ABY9EI80_9GAMM|nr:hypothetical protein [Microbulbifer sp. MI-G]WKD51679.1 hypothetical protein M8T91_18665 [Microbulbifer sp. MI-G]